MIYRISVPSKCFLFGEYVSLVGGPCVVATGYPRFEFTVQPNGAGRISDIHPQSPTGRFVRGQSASFQSIDMNVYDPHFGRGGFGASSGQFVGAWVWNKIFQTGLSSLQKQISARELWEDFRRGEDLNGGAYLPSGADLIAQLYGKITSFSFEPFSVKRFSWMWTDLEFWVVRTGQKLKTHEHLRHLPRSNFSTLSEISARGLQALIAADKERFLEAIQQSAKELERMHLVCEPTLKQLEIMKTHDEILAAKGAGALGQDAIVLFFNPTDQERIAKVCADLNLEKVFGSKELSPGLSVHCQWEPSDEMVRRRPVSPPELRLI